MSWLCARTAGLSGIGGRSRNEDAWGQKGGYWVVADGLGGHGGGEIASQLAVDTILNKVNPWKIMHVDRLVNAIAVAETAIQQRQQQEARLQRMRTTIVVLCSNGRQAFWVHVGDSRLYHFRHGHICHQTSDHSVSQFLANAGEITSSEIRFHEDRNRLLRSLGGGHTNIPTAVQTPISLETGDAFLLCTDGFWEYVTEHQMEASLAQAVSPERWLQHMKTILLDQVKLRHDNYTAVAVFFERRRWSRFLICHNK